MSVELSLDWGTTYVPHDTEASAKVKSAADALLDSLRSLARVDMGYIAERMGVDEDKAADRLGGAVFKDPYAMEWQTSEEYLSGDLYHKLDIAEKVNKANGLFGRNVDALTKALPPRVPSAAIYVSLGSPWLPTDVVQDFISHLMGGNCDCEVLHDPGTGTWNVRGKGKYRHRPESRQIFGTKRALALDIVEDTLNGRPIRVTDEVDCPDNKSGKKRVLNAEETLIAVERQQRICGAFDAWVWSDSKREKRLVDLYNHRYCGFQPRRFDGSILDFPGMAHGVSLRPYQKNAVMRCLCERDVLVAHDVGAGKTYTAIAACMELRRMGISKKNMVVVPNNVLSQWSALFQTMYPEAHVLLVTPASFVPKSRQAMLAEIRDGDYDAVLIAYSSFDLIPLSKEDAIRNLDQRIRELEGALRDPSRSTSAVKREHGALRKKREQLEDEQKKDPSLGITFDQLGVTRLFVDEAHNFKNLSYGGSRFRSRGMSRKGSNKCEHMLSAVRCTQRRDGGAVFLSGTILTNSIADCWVFQTYLQPGTLSLLELRSFDAWAGMYARKVTGFEIDVDTSTYRNVTRFGGFGNLTELSAVLANVADFHHLGPDDDLPTCEGRADVLVRRTPGHVAYYKYISRRADAVRRGRVSMKDDNLLKICGDGRKAALDIRLVREGAEDEGTKVLACAQHVHRIWCQTSEERSAQLVFCDISTPKDGFNVYDELKSVLVGMGIPEHEVAFVHDAHTDAEREHLFAAVRAGEVRVLVGSTSKLGLGVNVQDRLIAAHHLDVPWRPADMAQREGRILRQGNANSRVEIYRYVTEGSFDAYSWQIVERKQRTIDELLSGTYAGGILESDIGDTALGYAEIKALALNNPLLKERVEVANEIERTITLQRKTAALREEMLADIDARTTLIECLEQEAERLREDTEYHDAHADGKLTREQRWQARAILSRALERNAFKQVESQLCRYQGFRVVLPAGMDPERPYLWLCRATRHKVELGEAKELGILTRMDNTLDRTHDRLADVETKISEQYRAWESIEAELADKAADRTDRIRELKARLARIDVKLEEANGSKREDA